MKIIIATGGTGGHIYPATALAEKLISYDSSIQLLFIGNENRMENVEIPKLGYRFIGIKAASFNNKKNKFEALKILYKSYKECVGIVKNFQPDIVIGFGGYVTVPVVLAAHYLKIKTIIHEQNSIAGLANRTLGHFVDKVITCYSSCHDAFNSKKILQLGNPRESLVTGVIKDKYIFSQFDLDCDKKTILIVMGSLGSESVNNKMIAILENMKQENYNVIYVTGKNNYDNFKERIVESDNVKIVPYVNQLSLAANCALVVSRGGATSAAEYMALGVPTIIIPSPYVPNNHQYLNAKAMFDNGASYLLEEKDLTVDSLLTAVNSLINDDEKLADMALKAKEMSHVDCTDKFIELINQMVGSK